MKQKVWTNEEIVLLERFYPDEQIAPVQMAKLFNCSWNAIAGKAQRLGLRRPRSDKKLWTHEEIALLESHYPNLHVSLNEMEKVFGRSWQSIKGKARSLGLYRSTTEYQNWSEEEIAALEMHYSDIRVPPSKMEVLFKRNWNAIRAKAQSLGFCRRDFNRYNPHYFRDITTEKQAYWLGVLASDGTVDDKNGHHIIALGLHTKDRVLIERFRDEVAPGASIYETKNHTCKIQFTSKEIIHDLARYNIVPNKTNIFVWPSLLPEDLSMAFLLGYFDGDGSLFQYSQGKRKYWQWSLVGTLPFITEARKHIQHYAQVEIKEPRRCHKDRSPYLYLIYAQAQEKVIRIDRALNASGLGLPRKHFLS